MESPDPLTRSRVSSVFLFEFATIFFRIGLTLDYPRPTSFCAFAVRLPTVEAASESDAFIEQYRSRRREQDRRRSDVWLLVRLYSESDRRLSV